MRKWHWGWLVCGLSVIGSSPASAQEKPMASPILLPEMHSPGSATSAPGTGHSTPTMMPGVKDVTPPTIPGIVEPMHHANGHGGGHSWNEPEMHGGWYGMAEVLIMRARRGGLEFAIPDSSNNFTVQGRAEQVTPETRAGFRAGVGYTFANGIDTRFVYTWFRSGDERSVSAPIGGLIYPVVTRPGIIDTVTSSTGQANLEYSTYDLDFGKTMNIVEHVSVRVGAGLRFANIRQDFTVLTNGGDARAARYSSQNDFYGVGPMLGGEANFHITENLSFLAKGNAALVSGELRTPLSETNNNGATVVTNFDNRYDRVIPNINLGFGLQYHIRNFHFAAGYEMTHWFNLIQQPVFVDDFSEGKFTIQRGDLSLEGFFVRFGVDF